jgi:hypothetical protein
MAGGAPTPASPFTISCSGSSSSRGKTWIRFLSHATELDVTTQTMTSQTYGTKNISGCERKQHKLKHHKQEQEHEQKGGLTSASSSYVKVKSSFSGRFRRSTTASRIRSMLSAKTFNAFAAVLASPFSSMTAAAAVITDCMRPISLFLKGHPKSGTNKCTG